MDYYTYIISYKNNDQEIINKYFSKIEKDIIFNSLIADCYTNETVQQVITMTELKVIMYMYYIIAMLELYQNQKNFANNKQIKCIINKIHLESDEDAEILIKTLPKMITTFTNKFTETHDFKTIFTNKKLNSIINYIYSRITEYVNDCLN